MSMHFNNKYWYYSLLYDTYYLFRISWRWFGNAIRREASETVKLVKVNYVEEKRGRE